MIIDIKRWVLVGLIIVIIYLVLNQQGITELLAHDGTLLRQQLLNLGWLGPLAVIILMAVAVVISPLPSAPIALGSGAIYGHLWGTLYVVLGALSGAVIAFSISRYIRPKKLALWLENRFSPKKYGSQHSLMLMVCASRLLPFVSFDIVSYAAGLTPLRMWRFTLATMVGIVPASFLLAHMGSELSSFDPVRIGLALMVLVLLGIVPLVYRVKRTSRG